MEKSSGKSLEDELMETIDDTMHAMIVYYKSSKEVSANLLTDLRFSQLVDLEADDDEFSERFGKEQDLLNIASKHAQVLQACISRLYLLKQSELNVKE